MTFSLYDEPVTDDEAAKTLEALNSYRKLFEFSEKLLANYDLRELLDALMDAVVAITNADKGFLILLEGNELRVKVARNLKRENLADALAAALRLDRREGGQDARRRSSSPTRCTTRSSRTR